MSKIKKTLAITFTLTAALMLSACNKEQEPSRSNDRTSDSVKDVIGQLNPVPIKQFPDTANDAADIAILEDYDQRFTDMTDSMEIEVAEMREKGTLTPEFEQQRQKDNVKSALIMLKELDLKTEQGRYIQGLLYSYWEHQAKVLDQPNTQADSAQQVDQLNQYLHAQSQLHHWKNKQTPED